jgi:hypothetical protein
MLDECNDCISPALRVGDCKIVAIDVQKLHHCHEAGAFVSLRKCVRLRNARKQPDSEGGDILFPISECISRTRQGALEQTRITEDMRLSGDSYDSSIDLDDCLHGQPLGIIWQVLREFWGSER